MKKGNKRFSIEGKPLYPHVKLTRERFPRALITRIIEDDDAEYFGAFLNRTNARILIDFLNRVFRLRSCEIEVDGSFNYPCTVHYKGRCIAPCVADLCSEEEYGERVGLVRLFLMNDRPLFRSVITTKIGTASDDLDFEGAAKWRDVLTAVEGYWDDARHSVWLDGTSDTFQARESEHGLDVFLISQKGRRVLGERVFSFPGAATEEMEEAISEVIEQFYRFHAPKEIRVPTEFPRKRDLEAALRSRVGRRVPIVRLSEKNRKVSTELAVYRSSAELDVERKRIELSDAQVLREVKLSLGSQRTPKRIIAVDVSHISGSNHVAAAIVWTSGRIDSGSSRSWLSDASGELESIKEFVRLVLRDVGVDENVLLLIDGGPSQLKAAALNESSKNVSMIAAVKPPDDHEAISHFLTVDRRRIDFDIALSSHRLLLRLRDEAHDFSNAVHRDTRDYDNYYRLAEILPSLNETERRKVLVAAGSAAAIASASRESLVEWLGKERSSVAEADIQRFRDGTYTAVRPLVVPTRLQAENGAAEDLRPIDNVVPRSRRF